MHTPITEDAYVEPPEEANVPKVTVRRLRRAFKMLAMCCDLHIRRVQAVHGGSVYLQQRGVRVVGTVHCSQGTGDNSFCHIEEMVSRIGATRAKTPTTQEIWSRSPDISRELLLSTGLQCNLHGLNSFDVCQHIWSNSEDSLCFALYDTKHSLSGLSFRR